MPLLHDTYGKGRVRVLRLDRRDGDRHEVRELTVQAMVEGAPDQARDFVADWIKIAEPALPRARRAAAAGVLGTTRYWTPAIHVGAFDLPPYVAECLRGA